MALLMLSTKKVVTRMRLDIFAGPRVFGTWSLLVGLWSFVVYCLLLDSCGLCIAVCWSRLVACRLLVVVCRFRFVGSGLLGLVCWL